MISQNASRLCDMSMTVVVLWASNIILLLTGNNAMISQNASWLCDMSMTVVVLWASNIILLLTGIRVIASVLFSETPTIVTVIQLLLPELSVNKCFIIPNSIRYYDIIKRHRTCSPCLLLSSTSIGIVIGNFSRIWNVHYRVSSHESMD